MASSRILRFPITTVVGRKNDTRPRFCRQVVRAQSYGDSEGGSRRHIVDASLRLLMERMEEIRAKDHLERCFYNDKVDDDLSRGWNYYDHIPTGDSCNRKLPEESMVFFHELSKIITVVAATFGCTVLSGTFFIFLVSVFVHLSHQLMLITAIAVGIYLNLQSCL